MTAETTGTPTWRDGAALAARLLIAALFAGGAVQKIMDPASSQELLSLRGLPEVLIWPALVFSAGAAGALVAGRFVPAAALALAGYSALTSVFHLQPDDPWQMTIFVKNWSIAGGCLALSALGPGRFRV
ncbi:DoxX family protein [Histidinibacterium lentulum]|uniref:DoxX family membrane protein n=1 Tax=Histidinibacterium lentulum TaxID=2480588 RepID=A0A3N2R9H3_9RHOB|nr:DoxX family membrane protein [Histidinibacterium lentulum]ROU04129.1 DoxX family membrane protein [Histidinibacterium lentulum]